MKIKRSLVVCFGFLRTVAGVSAVEVRLDDLTAASHTQGWGVLQVGKSISGNPLSIAGKSFAHEWASDAIQFPNQMNYAALAGMRKPTSFWTFYDETSDSYMQRLLYLGAYPVAPYPNNHHCVAPTAEGQKLVDMFTGTAGSPAPVIPADDKSPEAQQLAYAPLLKAMRGKKWVLTPHCVETTTAGVKVNLFEVPGGYVAPVTFGGKTDTATVRLRNIPGLTKLKCEVLHPGIEKPASIAGKMKEGNLEVTVPLVSGCAMVRFYDR